MVNYAKFHPKDWTIYKNIIRDVFPGVRDLTVKNFDLEGAMRDQCRRLNLQPHPYLLEKVTQLHDTLKVRHGVFIVGEAAAGKSSIIDVLAGTLTELHEMGMMEEQRTTVERLNPIAVTTS